MRKIVCKTCGYENEARALFCSACGRNIDEHSSYSNFNEREQIYLTYLLEVKAIFGEYEASKKKI